MSADDPGLIESAWHRANETRRRERAEAELAQRFTLREAARAMPDDVLGAAAAVAPRGMPAVAAAELDHALEAAAVANRACAHAIFKPDCPSCDEQKDFALRDGVGWARDMAARQTPDLGPLPTMGQMQDQTPRIVLTGDAMTAFDAFALAAAALETHHEQGQKLQADYRAALEAVSRMAAARNRGR